MENNKIDLNDLINIIPLEQKTTELAQQIIDENDTEKIKNLTNIFNLNQAKKNTLRVLKLNALLDKVSDTMIEKFEKRPGEFSNADLISYMTTVQSAIDRANKSLQLVDATPAIQVNQVNVNIESEKLDRESRQKVADAVKAIMAKINKEDYNDDSDEIIIEASDDTEQDKEAIDNDLPKIIENKLKDEE